MPSGETSPTVMVVDDDFLVREAFRAFFGSRDDLELW